VGSEAGEERLDALGGVGDTGRGTVTDDDVQGGLGDIDADDTVTIEWSGQLAGPPGWGSMPAVPILALRPLRPIDCSG
jgi:hypothetical protein